MPIFIALFLLLGGGTTSVLANSSLPGDVLYPVKINLNEKVESMLAITEKGDAEVSVKQASRRLKEAEELSAEGKLTVKLNDQMKASFENKIDSLEQHIINLESSGATTTAIKLKGEWKDEIGGHYKAYLVLSGMSTTTSTSTTGTIIFDLKNTDSRENSEKDKKEIKKIESKNDDDRESEDEDDSIGEVKVNTSVQGSGNGVSAGVNVGVTTSKSITMSEVAKHNTTASCYTVVRGNVYDVTSWIKNHPGGEAAIKGMCGLDATSAFTGQHDGQARPESELTSFKIGVLAK